MFSGKKYILISLLILVFLLAACQPGQNSITTTSADLPAGFPTPPATTNPTSTMDQTPSSTTESLVDYPFEPTVTGIYMTRDGRILSAEITPFDNSSFSEPRYMEEGLKAFVQENVTSYNAAKGFEAVTVEELEVKDKVAKLVLGYDSLETFMDFQGKDFGIRQLRLVSRDEAVRNYDIQNLVDASGNEVGLIDALRSEDVMVLVISGRTTVTVNGNIRCFSRHVVSLGANAVRCDDEVGYSFIIFR